MSTSKNEFWMQNMEFQSKDIIDAGYEKVSIENSNGYSLHIRGPKDVRIKGSTIKFIMVGRYYGDRHLASDEHTKLRHHVEDIVNIDANGGFVLIQDSVINSLTITNLGDTGEVYIKTSKIAIINITK